MRARRALGLLRLERIDLAPLDLIRTAPLERLQDAEYLETMLLPLLGLSADGPHVFPESLQQFLGRGLRHWQYPNQFSKYLVALSRERIQTYLEIGVQHGGTFAITVEYLARFNPLKAAYAVDVNRVPSLKEYAKNNPAIHLLREDSGSERFREFVQRRGPFDLGLIDGDHSEEACRRDFESIRERARVIALHDIVEPHFPGVGKVWAEIQRRYAGQFSFTEYVEQYPDVRQRLGYDSLGIGLAVSNQPITGSEPH